MITFLVLIAINFILVELVDRQNIPNQIFNMIFKRLTNNTLTNVWLNKPFNCSYCLTFWISLIFLLCTFKLSFVSILFLICFALINAKLTLLTYYILDCLNLLNDLVFNKLHN
jgi:hypothetical protein